MISHTTTRLRLHLRDWLRVWLAQRDPLAIGALLAVLPLLLFAIFTSSWRGRAPAVASVPTPALAPIIILATPRAAPVPTLAPVQAAAMVPANTTRRAIVVYGAADLATAIGAVEPGRTYQVLARNGADWLQVDISGGTGIVFVRTADLFDIPADLADLAPPPAPAVVYVAVQAAATPAPPPPTVAPQQLVILDRQQWAVDAQRHTP